MKKKPRVLSFLLTLIFCVSLFPCAALAEEPGEIAPAEEPQEAEEIDSGVCGDELIWTLSSDGCLKITGSGEMYDYDNVGPWVEEHSKEITSAEVGEGVTRIGDTAFCCCHVLNQVKLPESLTEIGLFGFCECPLLEEVTLPANLEILADGAFEQCRGLKNITIPAGVKTLGPECFLGCESLTEIRFEGTAPEIGVDAFLGVTATAYYPADDPGWTEELRQNYGGTITWVLDEPTPVASGQCGEDMTWKLSEDGVLTITGSGDMWDYTVNDPPEWLSVYAKRIQRIVIQEGVTGIGQFAFFTGPYTLTPEAVLLPNSLERIGDFAFTHSVYGEITLPTGLREIGDDAFEACDISGQLRIPGTVERIGEHAFLSCSQLESLYLEDGVGEIGDEAFVHCSSLKEVRIPASVTVIGSRAFGWGVYALMDIYYEGTLADWEQIAAEDAVTKHLTTVHCTDGDILPLPADHCGDDLVWALDEDGVLTISGTGDMWDFDGEYLPWGSEKNKIVEVRVLTGVSGIGYGAFGGCNKLESVTIPEGVTRIGGHAFSGCRALKEIALPESTTSIGDCAFIGSGLNSVTIPEGVASLGEAAFEECSNLKTVTIPGSVKSIGRYAFINCGALTCVSIGEGVNTIEDNAFYRCLSLAEIRLPSTVTTVETQAFCYCSSMTRIRFDGKAPSIGEHAFGDVTAKAYYPAGDPSWTEDVRQNYSGTVTWVPYVSGDVNGDGQMDVLDLVRLRKHLAGMQVELNEICSDLDGDGEVTILDLMRLRKLLVGAAE